MFSGKIKKKTKIEVGFYGAMGYYLQVREVNQELTHFSIMEEQEKYQSINQRINQSVRYYRVPTSVEKGAALNLLLTKVKNKEGKKSFSIQIFPYLQYAASLAAAAVIIVAFIIFSGKSVIKNESMQSISFRLPDQSRVIITNGSEISFKKRFTDRIVTLKGEGYFEVFPGNTFTVKTTNGSVQVIGTRFSIRDQKKTFHVECYEGKVNVNHGGKVHLLGKGDGLTTGGKDAELFSIQESSYPVYARFIGSYVEAEITEVFKDMEQFFGITIRSGFQGKRYYTGFFETGSLENALILLCEPLELTFTIQNQINVFIQ